MSTKILRSPRRFAAFFFAALVVVAFAPPAGAAVACGRLTATIVGTNADDDLLAPRGAT